MTREEALGKVQRVSAASPVWFPADLIDSLEALGLLKLDEPAKKPDPDNPFNLTLCGLSVDKIDAFRHFYHHHHHFGVDPQNTSYAHITSNLKSLR